MGELDEFKIIAAITRVGTEGPGHVPSAPIEELLQEFVRDGKLREVAEAWTALKKAKPGNARVVGKRLPGFLWGYWSRHGLQIDHPAWLKHRPEWAGEIRAALTHPGKFAQVVDQMDQEIRSDYSKPMPG